MDIHVRRFAGERRKSDGSLSISRRSSVGPLLANISDMNVQATGIAIVVCKREVKSLGVRRACLLAPTLIQAARALVWVGKPAFGKRGIRQFAGAKTRYRRAHAAPLAVLISVRAE